MSEVKIRWKSKGFRQILTGSGTQSAVASAATAIQAKANANASSGGFESRTWAGNYGGGRWIASVSSTDRASAIAESTGKALSKAVGK